MLDQTLCAIHQNYKSSIQIPSSLGNNISDETSPLTRIILHTPGRECFRVQSLFPTIDRPGYVEDNLGRDSIREYSRFLKLFKNRGIEIIQVTDIIDDAIIRGRANGSLNEFITHYFPHLLECIDTLNHQALIGSTPPGGTIVEPLQWMYYVRDPLTILDEGIIINNFEGNSRSNEISIMRFCVEQSILFKKSKIIHDFNKDGSLIQGGDIVILDKNNVLLGVGNMTSECAAKVLAQKLNKNIWAIQMPTGIATQGWTEDQYTPINKYFLHLDTLVNIVGEKKILIPPYLFSDSNDRNDVILSMCADYPESTAKKSVVNSLLNLGKVNLFSATTGEKKEIKQRLEVLLKEQFDFRVIYVGGQPKNTFEEKIPHLIEDVFPEIRFQGANAFVIDSETVITFSNNCPNTIQELKYAGVKVSSISAPEISRWHGGPHCMTLPISRSKI